MFRNGIKADDYLLAGGFEGLSDIFYDGGVVVVERFVSAELLDVVEVTWAGHCVNCVAERRSYLCRDDTVTITFRANVPRLQLKHKKGYEGDSS